MVLDLGYVTRTSVVDRSDSRDWQYWLNTVVVFGSSASANRVLAVVKTQLKSLQEPNLHGTVAAEYAQGVTVGIVDRRRASHPIVGSGVIVSSSGIVATNRHVIEGIVGRDDVGGRNSDIGALIWQEGSDGVTRPWVLDIRRYSVVTGIEQRGVPRPDDASDLAFVDLGIEGIPCANLLESLSSLVPGQGVLACGYPKGDSYMRDEFGIRQRMPFTHSGMISALRTDSRRELEQLVCDLSVVPGSSGSPVFLSTTGELAGIVSHALVVDQEVKRFDPDGDPLPSGPEQLLVYATGPSSLVLPVSTIKRAQELVEADWKGPGPRETWEQLKAAFDKYRDDFRPHRIGG